MDRRSFLLSGAAALLASELPGIAGIPSAPLAASPAMAAAERRKKSGTAPAAEDFTRRITRDFQPLPPLKVKEIDIKVGAESPFSVLHVSDTHLTRVDNRDDEAKMRLAAGRSRWAAWGEHYLDEAIRYAADRGMYMMHTGDLCDFVSEANLDSAALHLGAADWFVSAGNHEYSKYVGEAREDEAYKADSRDKVQGAFPNDLTFASRIIGGVNFVSLDDVYYNITEAQHAQMDGLQRFHHVGAHAVYVGNFRIFAHIQAAVDAPAQMLGELAVQILADMALGDGGIDEKLVHGAASFMLPVGSVFRQCGAARHWSGAARKESARCR